MVFATAEASARRMTRLTRQAAKAGDEKDCQDDGQAAIAGRIVALQRLLFRHPADHHSVAHRHRGDNVQPPHDIDAEPEKLSRHWVCQPHQPLLTNDAQVPN